MEKVKLLLYCTKAKPNLWQERDENNNKLNNFLTSNIFGKTVNFLNGKIVAECDCDKVEEIFRNEDCVCYTKSLSGQAFCHFSLLNEEQLNKYFGFVSELTKVGYALHISNLKIFDKPKELDDFTTKTPVDYDSIVCDSCTELNCDCKKCRYSCDYQQVIKAPKNMMKVCEWDIEDKVLISIKPEWLCKILNGEKTIEVRRKVLNCMRKK